MARAYSDEEIERMLNSRPRDWWAIFDELKDEAESIPLIAAITAFTLGLALGFTISKK